MGRHRSYTTQDNNSAHCAPSYMEQATPVRKAIPAAKSFALDPAAVAVFESHGLKPTAPKGNSSWGKHMVCAEYDDVPYCIDNHGHFDKILHGVTHRKLTILRHHGKVKAVYQYLSKQGVGDIWVLCGGGGQLQAFFGNPAGYIGILYLDLEDLAEHKRLSASGYLAACGNAESTLVVQGAGSLDLFDGMQVPGVRVKLFGQA